MFIGIVADDLTGAADSVAPFAQRGHRAGVGLFLTEDAAKTIPDWEALALNTELRDRKAIKPTLIASIVRRATRRLKEREPRVYFKKIDSTLRGHLRPELDGMRSELPGRIALICPASPANGRTVENGILRVHGVPLAQTEFVRSIPEPTMYQSVRSAFGMTDDPTSADISLSFVRKGRDFLEAEIKRLADADIQTLFCDALTQEDLQTLAEVVLAQPERFLSVGSAGLTRAFAGRLPLSERRDKPAWNNMVFSSGRVLVVVGSRHENSRRQIQRLIRGAGLRPVVLEIPSEDILETLRSTILEGMENGNTLTLLLTPEEDMESRWMLERSLIMLPYWEESGRSEPPFDGYIVTGGETALYLCNGLWGHSLEIVGESEPGVVRAILSRFREWPDVPIILKAGGFGDEATLTRCLGLE